MKYSWYLKEKPTSCSGCNYEDKNCTLKCKAADFNATYNLIFLFEMPEPAAAAKGTLWGPEIRSVCNKVVEVIKTRTGTTPEYSLLYSVCAHTRSIPKSADIEKCSSILLRRIADLSAPEGSREPRAKNIILAFGKGALKSLGVKFSKYKAVRGSRTHTKIGNTHWDVVPTLSMRELYVKPSLTNVILEDAMTMWKVLAQDFKPDKLDNIAKEYIYPTSISEVKDLVDHIINYNGVGDTKGRDPSAWPISLDIETTGLNPRKPGMKTLCISAAWDDYKACAIPYMHKDSTLDPALVLPHLKRLLTCDKRTIWHGGTFDYQWLRAVDGIEVNNVWWDTQNAEHYLRENNQGFYGLKDLAKVYYRRYTGYEGELKTKIADSLKDIEVRKRLNRAVVYENADSRGVFFSTKALHDLEDQIVDATLRISLLERGSEERDSLTEFRKKGWAAIKREYKKQGETAPKIPTLAKVEAGTPEDSYLYELAPLSLLLKYAAVDTDLCRLICKEQRKAARTESEHSLPDLDKIMETLYVPGVYCLSRMRERGLPVDEHKARRFIKEMGVASLEYKSKLGLLICDPDFNANSPKQICDTLHNTFGLDLSTLPKTKSNAPSTDKHTMKYLSEKHANKPLGFFAHSLSAYKAVNSAKTLVENTFLGGDFPITGKIHTTFNITGTKTARLSSSGPAFQNIADVAAITTVLDTKGCVIGSTDGWAIKDLVICDDLNYVIYNLDIKAAEIRALCAYIAKSYGTSPLIEAVRAGRDIPSYVCTLLFGRKVWDEYKLHATWVAGSDPNDPDSPAELRLAEHELPRGFYDVETVYNFVNTNKSKIKAVKELRVAGKRGLYGTIYGGSAYTIAKTVYGVLSTQKDILKMQLDYGQEIQDRLFKEFPGIRNYVVSTLAFVRKHKWVKSLFGRRRRFPMLSRGCAKIHRKEAEREAINFCIQSTSSDLVLSLLISIERDIDKIGGDVRLSVHDSVAGFMRRERMIELRPFLDEKIIKETHRRYPWLPVDFIYDLDVGPSYYNLQDYDKYIEA